MGLVLVAFRYLPDHLEGLFALLLFFIALLLGAAVAVGIHTLLAAR
jgi:hypothetical protein